MLTSRSLHTTVIIAAAFFCVTPAAHGIVLLLSSVKQIPFSSRYSEVTRNQIIEAFKHRECELIKGYAVNAVSTLIFTGNTTAINSQLQALSGCPGATVQVNFRKIDNNCDWQVAYDAGTLIFQFTVNLSSPRIFRNGLVVPPSRSICRTSNCLKLNEDQTVGSLQE